MHGGLSPVWVGHYVNDRVALTNKKADRNVCLDMLKQHHIIHLSALLES